MTVVVVAVVAVVYCGMYVRFFMVSNLATVSMSGRR